MKKTISIICAVQPKPNPGMSSVDLSFYAFARRNFPDADLRFLKICDEGKLHGKRSEGEKIQIKERQQMPFEYENLQDNLDELYKSDLIVYWGDFFHMAHYRESESQRQMKLGVVETYAQGLELADKHFFLTEAPEKILKKVIVFGENLLFNKIDNYASGQYADNLKSFLKNVDNVWMRDVFSALTISHIKNNYDRSYLGMDSSVFLKDNDLDGLNRNYTTETELSKDKIGVFFHRNSQNSPLLFKFAKKLAKATEVDAQWLPWRIDRKIKSKKRWTFSSLEIIQSEKEPSEGDLFDLVKNYKFVISDTYHVCVNAWRMGTPAICIGEYTTENDWDVSCGPAHAWRDKRWTFFSMIEALSYYVHFHELTDSKQFNKRIKQLTEALSKESNNRLITQFLHNQRNSIEKKLVEAINEVFDTSPMEFETGGRD